MYSYYLKPISQSCSNISTDINVENNISPDTVKYLKTMVGQRTKILRKSLMETYLADELALYNTHPIICLVTYCMNC